MEERNPAPGHVLPFKRHFGCLLSSWEGGRVLVKREKEARRDFFLAQRSLPFSETQKERDFGLGVKLTKQFLFVNWI